MSEAVWQQLSQRLDAQSGLIEERFSKLETQLAEVLGLLRDSSPRGTLACDRRLSCRKSTDVLQARRISVGECGGSGSHTPGTHTPGGPLHTRRSLGMQRVMNADADVEELLARLHKEEKDVRRRTAAEAAWRERSPLSAGAVLDPSSRAVGAWQVWMLFATLASAPFTPVDVAFSLSSRYAWAKVVAVLLEVVFLVDLALGFRLAFRLDDGLLIRRPATIARRYLRSWFAVDLLGALPLELAFVAAGCSEDWGLQQLKFVHVMRVAKLPRLMHRSRAIMQHVSLGYAAKQVAATRTRPPPRGPLKL